MAVGRVNVGGGGGKLNIFTQLNEPNTKEGIWLKTGIKHTHVLNDTELYFANAWVDQELIALMPYVDYFHAVATVGSDIYLSGGNSNLTKFYKYNTITNIWTQLSNMPYNAAQHTAVSIGTKIYFMGNYTGPSNQNYCYDTIENAWTVLKIVPIYFADGSAVAIDTKIYIMGSSNSSYYRMFYEYDTITDTWTKLQDTPSNMILSTASVVGYKIYLFAGLMAYCYDILDNTWTRLQDRPINLTYSTSVAIGSNIYVMGGYSGTISDATVHIYDTITNTWKNGIDMPKGLYRAKAAFVNDRIHILGGCTTYNNPTDTHIAFSLYAKVFPENTFVIFRNSELTGSYYTQFVSPLKGIEGDKFLRTISGFNDAWVYANGDLLEFPAYYGDGTHWIKFKN